MTLISPTNERANRLIGIYSNLDKELYDAFRFLEPALENNEIILLLVDDSLDSSTVYNRMKEVWNISADEIDAMEDKGEASQLLLSGFNQAKDEL